MIQPKAVRLPLCFFAFASLAGPAFADHAGPSGAGGGGGLAAFGPGTVDEGHWSLGLRLAYTHPKQRSDAKLEALAASGVHAHNTNYTLNASFGAAYGVTHRLTLAAELPYVRRDHLREGEVVDEVAQLGSVAGVGDLSLLAKYRLSLGENGGFALVAGIKAPTGSTHQLAPDGERLETEHQPGTGSWDPIIGAAAGTMLGPLALSASALYQWSGKGAQVTRLGGRAQGGLALSHRFGPAAHHHEEGKAHDHHDHAEPHGHRSIDAFVELAGEWEGRQTVAGEVEADSGGESVWLSPGARFISAGGFSVAASVGLPLWQRIRASHPDNGTRLTLALGRAF